MSVGNYPSLVGETVSLTSAFNLNIAAVAGGAAPVENNVLRNGAGAELFLTVPAGSWILTGYITVNTDNANDTILKSMQSMIFNFTNDAGAGGERIAFGPNVYPTTIPANTATVYHQVSVAVSSSVPSFYGLYLTTQGNDQIINIPLGLAFLYAQYLGPTKTTNVLT